MSWTTEFTPLSLASSDVLPLLMLSHLPSWSAITLVGPDRKSYLHGQVTCDVTALDPNESTLGAHCDAKGKMWSLFRLFRHNDGYALFQPRSAIEADLKEFRKYAVFSKVDIEQSPDVCLGVLGENAESYIDQLSGGQNGNVRTVEGGTAVKISAQRWLLLIDPARAETLANDFAQIKCDESMWYLFDITEANPVLEQAEQNQHIPQALNLQAIGGISFTKGCYTGQETIARAKYRGTNKRAMYRISGPFDAPMTQMLTLERSVGENWRTAGNLLCQYQYSDGQATGLIILPNDLEPDTRLRIAGYPESIWTIDTLPYPLDNDE